MKGFNGLPMTSEKIPNEKIKVMNLIYGMNDGGAEHVVLNYLRDFKDDPDIDFRLYVYLNPNQSECNTAIKNEGLNAIYLDNPLSRVKIPIIRGPFNRIIRRKTWQKAINEFKPDIVHVHISELLDQTLIPIIRENVPVRFDTLHSNPYRYKGHKLRTIKRAFHKENIIPICLTNTQALQAKDHYGITNYEILRNGIDIDKVVSKQVSRCDARKALGIDENSRVVLGVGRLHEIKRYDLLIKAFAEALKRNNNMILLIAGKGECESSLKALVNELGISNKVSFLGYRTDTELLYCAADVFAMTSYTEASSLVLLDAQLMGTRCVISAGTPIENSITDKVRQMNSEASLEEWADALLDDNYVGKKLLDLNDIEVHAVSKKLKDIYIKYYNQIRK